jgi:hypothetical protein
MTAMPKYPNVLGKRSFSQMCPTAEAIEANLSSEIKVDDGDDYILVNL